MRVQRMVLESPVLLFYSCCLGSFKMSSLSNVLNRYQERRFVHGTLTVIDCNYSNISKVSKIFLSKAFATDDGSLTMTVIYTALAVISKYYIFMHLNLQHLVKMLFPRGFLQGHRHPINVNFSPFGKKKHDPHLCMI